LANGLRTGYAGNVMDLNMGGDVTGGTQLGPNLCTGVLCP